MIHKLEVGVRVSPSIALAVQQAVGIPGTAYTLGDDYYMKWEVSSIHESTALLARVNTAIMHWGHVTAEIITPQPTAADERFHALTGHGRF